MQHRQTKKEIQQLAKKKTDEIRHNLFIDFVWSISSTNRNGYENGANQIITEMACHKRMFRSVENMLPELHFSYVTQQHLAKWGKLAKISSERAKNANKSVRCNEMIHEEKKKKKKKHVD